VIISNLHLGGEHQALKANIFVKEFPFERQG
jgi:hypothetical protein